MYTIYEGDLTHSIINKTFSNGLPVFQVSEYQIQSVLQ